MTLTLRFAARSHPGLLREGNEDSVYAGPRLLAVADGMGGHAAGEVASAVAIAALAPLDEDVPGSDLLEALRGSAMSANAHLRDMVVGDQALEGMGTTLTAVLWAGSRLGLLHVGDSRCYLLRDGELTQITHDHTLVQTLVDEGRISEEEAGSHPQRSVITRVLDGRPGIDFDLSVREARTGDRYLLCSDGLTGPVGSRETLKEALLIPGPQEAVDRLVQLALRGGGPDNVTVIVADVEETDGPGTPSPVVAGAAAEGPQAPPPGIADSAASRAQFAEGRVPARRSDPGQPAARPRRRGRIVVVALLALALVGGAGAAGWAYVRSQYYVGVADRQVAVFRGVTGSVAGVRLSTVEQRSTVTTDELNELDLMRVRHGILAQDKAEALRIVDRLVLTALGSCPTPITPGRPVAPVSPAPLPPGCAVPRPVPAATPGTPSPLRSP